MQIPSSLSSVAQKNKIADQTQKALNAYLHSVLSGKKENELRSNTKEVVERLENVFDQYAVVAQVNLYDLEQEIEQNKASYKWSDQMTASTKLKKDSTQISDKIRNDLMLPVCDMLSLQPKTTLALLDGFYCQNPDSFHFLLQLEQKVENQDSQLCQYLGNRLQMQAQQLGVQMPSQGVDIQMRQLFQQLKQQGDPTTLSLSERFENCQNLYQQKIEENKDMIQNFYMKERFYLLTNLSLIFTHSAPKQSKFVPMNALVTLRETLIRGKDIISKLIQGLKRNLEWHTNETKLDDQQRKSVMTQIQREQEAILQILFSLATEQDLAGNQVDFRINHIESLLSYLEQTDFRGRIFNTLSASLMTQQRISQLFSNNNVYLEGKIRDLGIFTYLAILKIDVFADSDQEVTMAKKNLLQHWYSSQSRSDLKNLKDKIEKIKLDSLNSILVVATVQVFKSVEKLLKQDGALIQLSQQKFEAICSQPFIAQIEDMFAQSSVINESSSREYEHAHCQNEYLALLKSFLNLIYEPILLHFKKQKEIETVQKLTVDYLLKNYGVLSGFWKKFNSGNMNQLKMFANVLQEPLVNPHHYTYLLRILCGKKRFQDNCSQHVLRMLSTTNIVTDGAHTGNILRQGEGNHQNDSLLREFLSAYVILLAQLDQGLLDSQEKFDILSNLIVIFSKMLKQQPDCYRQLNDELSQVLQLVIPEDDEMFGAQVKKTAFEQMHGSNLQNAYQVIFADVDPSMDHIQHNPMLVLLVHSLFSFVARQQPDITNDVVKHNIDAITAIFQISALKKSTITLIEYNQIRQNIKINHMIIRICKDNEKQKNDYKVTCSYLKFIGRVFSTEYPQLLVNQRHQQQLGMSILNEMLIVVFAEIVENLKSFTFSSLGQFAKFCKRVIKVANILLKKFDCGQNNATRIDIQQNNPKFDLLLQLIVPHVDKIFETVLNNLQLEELRQGPNQPQYFQNKFLIKSLQNQGGAVIHEKTLVNKLIQQSIKYLNMIMKYTLEIEVYNIRKTNLQKDARGLLMYYIGQLNTVKQMRELMLEPKQSTTEKWNLVSTLLFYARAECSNKGQESYVMAPSKKIFLENNILAQEFIKLSCILWQTQPSSQRFDLKLWITKDGNFLQDDLRRIVIGPIVACFNQIKSLKSVSDQSQKMTMPIYRYLITSFEVLMICAQSQQSMVENVLSKRNPELGQLTKSLEEFFDARRNESLMNQNDEKGIKIQQTVRQLSQKIISFLQVLSTENRVPDLITPNLVHLINESVIKLSCVTDAINIKHLNAVLKPGTHFPQGGLHDYYSEMSQDDGEISSNHLNTASVFNHCLAVVTITDFLKLVQNVFRRDPLGDAQVRSVVQDLFVNQRFNSFFSLNSTFELKKDLNTVLGNLQSLNQQISQVTEENYDLQQQVEFHRQIQQDRLLDSEQANCTSFNHHLVPQQQEQNSKGYAGIFVTGFDGVKAYQGIKFLLQNLQKNWFFANITGSDTSDRTMYSQLGCLGSEFLISTQELNYLFVNNSFINMALLGRYISQIRMYNLCMSALVIQTNLEQTKTDFLIQIEKYKWASNLRAEKYIAGLRISQASSKSFQVLTSMFPLVDSKYPQAQRMDQSTSGFKASINTLIKQSFSQLKNVFLILKLEDKQLGSRKQLNHLGNTHSSVLFNQMELILNMLNLCVSESSLKGICPNKELAQSNDLLHFISTDFFKDLISIYSYHIENQSHEGVKKDVQIYIQVVRSALQIMESITKEKQYDVLSSKDQTEGILMQISKIVQEMQQLQTQEHEALFKDCLRTLQVALELLSDNTIQQFMSKKVNPPLSVIIQKLNSQNATQVEECILIVQFLNTYANQMAGAHHLFEENVLQYIQQNSCVVQAHNQDLYCMNDDQVQIRDPYHILWCQVLMFIRNMNTHLLEDQVHPAYLNSLISFLQTQSIDERIEKFQIYLLVDRNEKISHAVLEENELWMSIISQMFMQSEQVSRHCDGLLQGLKDCVIFGTTRFFCDQKYGYDTNIEEVSMIERVLKSKSANVILKKQEEEGAINPMQYQVQEAKGFSLLDLKAQVCMIKQYFCMTSGLLNLLLLDKQLQGEQMDGIERNNKFSSLFPANWDYLKNNQQNAFAQAYLFKDFAEELRGDMERSGYGSLLHVSFDTLFKSQEAMIHLYKQWNANVKDTRQLFDELSNIFTNDDEITKEYFGLNSSMSIFGKTSKNSAQNFEKVIELFETALQIGNQLLLAVFDKLRAALIQTTNVFDQNVFLTASVFNESASKLVHLYNTFEKDVDLNMRSSYSYSEAALSHKTQLIEHARKLKSVVEKVQKATLNSENSFSRTRKYYSGMLHS